MDFQFLGETIHSFAVSFLFFSVVFNKYRSNYSLGISGKTQLLLLMAFITRGCYLYTSGFLSIDSHEYIHEFAQAAFTFGTVLLLWLSKNDYDKENDTFWSEFLIFAAIILAVIVNHSFNIVVVMYTFSMFLKSIAVIPQMYLILKTKKVTKIMAVYLYAMGLHDWISKYQILSYDSITDASSVVYLGVYTISLILIIHLKVKVCTQCNDDAESILTITKDFVTDFPDINISNEKKGLLDSDLLWIDGNEERLENKEVLENKDECLENRETADKNKVFVA